MINLQTIDTYDTSIAAYIHILAHYLVLHYYFTPFLILNFLHEPCCSSFLSVMTDDLFGGKLIIALNNPFAFRSVTVNLHNFTEKRADFIK